MDNTCPNVIETEETNPPLDTFRRNSVALSIEALAFPTGGGAPIPALSGWMLALLACVLAGLALLARRQP